MSDNRSVSTDALATLGTIIDATAGRDAIHLAVEPTVAKMKMFPGQDVNVDGSCLEPWVGIVDPFLKGPVMPGQTFWLVLYPRTITSLRHVWAHPAFGDPSKPIPSANKAASEAWLREFVSKGDCPNYDDLIAAAIGKNVHQNTETEYPGYYAIRNDGEYLHFGGRDAHGEIPPEFWDHVEIVTGQTIPKHQRASWFSCSC